MADYGPPIVALVALFLWCAWREYVGEKRRDAKLFAACGAGGVVAGAVLWLA